MNERDQETDEINAVFKFTRSGFLKAVLLNAPDDQAQVTLERAIDRLFKPGCLSWVQRLFRK
ncbi:MAG: hypothetical protein KA113_15435 [Syntrophaceae bacterium]|nr:hypothetical protein [Syntrophaceae bacterium]